MKKKLSILLVLMIAVLISACSFENVTDVVSDVLSETEDESETSTESDYVPEDEYVQFVDAHGEWHYFIAAKGVPRNEYDPGLFKHEVDKLTYEGCETSLGIDVSKHQGSINWKKVKKAGYDFAIIRIGFRGYGQEGTLNIDSMFEENYKGAKAAGLDVGVYFFAQAINEEEAEEEADLVLEQLAGRDLELPIVYDPESILNDEARTDDVTGEQFTANTLAFCERIEEAGYDAMIYANLMWEAYQLDLSQLADYPIWYADYEETPQTPYDFDIWQYSCEGEVPGVAGQVDLNIRMIKQESKEEAMAEKYIKNGDKNIYMRIERPEGEGTHPVIILCHGLGADSNAYSAYAKMLNEAGFIAVYFDFCGGGYGSKSDGLTTDMSVLTEASDLSAVMDEVLSMSGVDRSRLYLMGESQGGFVAAYEAAQRPEDVKALVLFYPAFVIRDDTVQRFGEDPANLPEDYTILGMKLGNIYGRDALSVDIYDEIKKYTGPVLILHGDRDRIVPYSYSERAVKVYDNAQLVCIEGSDHGFNGKDEDRAGELMLDFIKE